MPELSAVPASRLANLSDEFYATHSYDKPPEDYMEETDDTPNDDEFDDEFEDDEDDDEGG